MLIILSLFVLGIVFLLFSIIAERNDMYFLFSFTLILSITLLFIFGVTGVCGIIVNVDKAANIVSLNEEYKSLTYQLDNIDTLYANSRANDRKELFNQIEKWNSSIAANQLRHESLWTNWFYPINYSQFKLIELP